MLLIFKQNYIDDNKIKLKNIQSQHIYPAFKVGSLIEQNRMVCIVYYVLGKTNNYLYSITD